MSFYDAIRVGASGAADFEVERSLRFNDDDSPYLELTPSAAGSNQMTFSFWVKRGNNFGSSSVIFSSGVNNARGHIYFETDNKLRIQPFNSSGANAGLSTNMVFRDPSAWYHIVISFNNSAYNDLASTANVYVNGAAVTFTADNYNVPTGGNRLNDAQEKRIGEFRPDDGGHFDGYLAEFNFIDGQVLTPSSFGETNSVTGQWVPIDTSGLTFGTEGFRLKFADNSGTTATTLGKDTSGQGNNWTPNNFSVSAGAGNDSLEDTPTNNFSTLNPLFGTGTTFGSATNGNLDYSFTPNQFLASSFLIPSTGKWYAEFVFTAGALLSYFGVRNPAIIEADNFNGVSAMQFTSDGSSASAPAQIRVDNTYVETLSSAYADNDIMGVKVDRDNGTIQFTKNGSNVSTAVALSGMSDSSELVFAVSRSQGGGLSFSGNVNFGQRPFSYLPTGYKSLSSQNLPDPTILLPNKHFNTLLYAGNGAASRAITGLDFQPDWVWLKSRTNSDYHQTHDAVRGIPAGVLFVNVAAAEDSNYPLDSFDSNGFTTSADASDQQNTNGQNYVAWNWDAGETDGATYTVKVVSDSGNKYRFNDFGTSAVTLDLAEGGTYTFDGSDSSMSGHPFVIGTAANGSVYSTGVTYQLDGASVTYSAYTSGYSSATTRKLIITVPASAPQLYYWCSIHSGMGGAINTNSTLGSSNFGGSIQSTVKVNATAGFSIVTYTGTGADGTVGHGLGVTPNVVIVKNRDSGQHWSVKHKNLSSGYNVKLNLNEAQGQSTGSTNGIIADLSSSSNFSLTRTGNTGNYDNVNKSGEKHVAYCFSGVTGYSKFGLYKGNGNATGPFVYLGFKPSWIMIKRKNLARNWLIFDNKRNTFNVVDEFLEADTVISEATINGGLDFLSNGFKLTTSDSDINANDTNPDEYIYFAFAESPFKNSRAR